MSGIKTVFGNVSRSIWFWGAIVLVILVIISLLIVLPILIRNELESFLVSQGATNLTYKSADVSLLTRELRIQNLRMQNPGQPEIYVNKARIRILLLPLIKNRLIFDSIAMEDSNIHARLGSDGTWDIAGLKISSEQDKSHKQANQEWIIQPNNFTLKNVDVNLAAPDLAAVVKFKSARFERRSSTDKEKTPSKQIHAWQYRVNAGVYVSMFAQQNEFRARLVSSGTWPITNKADLNATAVFSELVITNKQSKRDIFRTELLNVSGIKTTKGNVTIDKVVMSNSEMGHLTKNEQKRASIARLEQIQIQQLSWLPGNNLQIKSIAIKSARVSARRLKTGQWLPVTKSKQPVPAKSKPGSTTIKHKNSLKLNIGTIELETPARIIINDESIAPPVKTTLMLNTGKLTKLDSSRQDRPSPFRLSGTINKYGRFTFTGGINLFAANTTFNVQVSIQKMDLPPISPYVVPKTGYQMTQGRLDLAANINAINGQVTGSSKLTLKKLKIKPVDQKIIEQFTSRLTMPLETIILILDDKNKFDLNVPVSGTVGDPEFSFTEVLNQALVGALRTASLAYLKYYFQPYGALVTIVQIGEKVFKMRLQAVYFAPGSSTLDQKARDYLAHVTKLMLDKKRLDLTICGKAVPADEITDSQQAADLARTRSENTRDFLVKELRIDSGRLYICQPEVDDQQDAIPRVDLEF